MGWDVLKEPKGYRWQADDLSGAAPTRWEDFWARLLGCARADPLVLDGALQQSLTCWSTAAETKLPRLLDSRTMLSIAKDQSWPPRWRQAFSSITYQSNGQLSAASSHLVGLRWRHRRL